MKNTLCKREKGQKYKRDTQGNTFEDKGKSRGELRETVIIPCGKRSQWQRWRTTDLFVCIKEKEDRYTKEEGKEIQLKTKENPTDYYVWKAQSVAQQSRFV